MHATLPNPAQDRAAAPNARHRRVLISGGLSTGGPQTHIPLLCSVLRESGAEITIASASTNWSRAAIDALRGAGVRVCVSPFGFGPLQILGKAWAFLVWPFVLRRDYDVLYCIGVGRMHLWAARFLRKGGFGIYHEIVECPLPGSLGERISARMNALLATSASIAEAMGRLVPGVPARPIPSITAAAPMAPPAPRPARGANLLRIAFLGRLVPHKRPEQLVTAFADWNRRAPIAPARLDLYGADYEGEGERLRERIAEFGLADCVSLRGAYSTGDLDRIFAETDLVVLPSRYEGLPIVLVEAMQRGVPVVATSAGGIAELGLDNPDVLITPGIEWDDFVPGLMEMATRIREGKIDAVRLHTWTESRYGYAPAAAAWRGALLEPESFFAVKTAAEVAS